MTALAAEEIDIVAGDFNQYQIDAVPAGFTEQHAGPGPTTYGTGKLDRVFVKDRQKCHAYLFGNPVKPAYTDQRGIGLRAGVENAAAASSLVDMRCSTCAQVHGAWISVFKHWHECKHCHALYCGACGGRLPQPSGGWLHQRHRQCPWGGETRLLS